MSELLSEKTTKIRDLNDRFRCQCDCKLGFFTMTPRLQSLSVNEQQQLIRAVRGFNEFTEGNDSYCEHDFGAVEVGGEAYFWKIDYFDPSLEYGSDDPSNAITKRVMTIMHGSEY
jgi:hypothetical protein